MPKAKMLPSGSWRARAYLGKDDCGKKIYKSFTAPTRKEAELLAAQAAVHRHRAKDTLTVGEAVEQYINSKENLLSPSTLEEYKRIAKNHLNPIATIELNQITNQIIQNYINSLASKLSAKTVSNIWGLVLPSLKMFNPDINPKILLPPKKHIINDLPEAKLVIKAIKGTDIELPALLAMWLSLRMSEVRGIKYGDISNGVLTIRHSMLSLSSGDYLREQNKTYNSTRKLKLPKYLLELIGDGDPDELVVKETSNVIYKRFVKTISAAGIKHIRFHDLRHLNASVMLQLGIPEKYAMERGGWATASTLRNIYQHTFSSERQEVDKKIDNFFESYLDDTKDDTNL